MDKVVAIIAAAGQGTRMGAPVSKVYLDILGRPLLAYTLDKFQSHSQIAEIIILTRDCLLYTSNWLCCKSQRDKVMSFPGAESAERHNIAKNLWIIIVHRFFNLKFNF